ncbi:preprotein translocase subunit YajC [Ammonicoccus fulvus]|uniref:Preprotein translocase subunit YajC n=1 Tax=Ammonicoccus fulvus TaxID=3138240 RepID=A0ABZ3FN17_9ACTN
MDPLTTGLLIALMVASFYFLIIRPNRRRQAEQTKLTESLQPGVRVMLSSGIYGTVVSVGEKQATVQIAPGIEVLVLKQAVLQVITPGSQFAEDGPVGLESPAEPEYLDDPASDPELDHRPVSDPDPETFRSDEDRKG